MAPLAPLVVPALIAGTAVSAVGMVMGGQAAAQEGRMAQRAAEYNARVQEREAEAIRLKASFEQKREVEAGRRRTSTLQAQIGKSGAVGAELLLEEQAAENELGMLLIGYGAETGARRALSQAELDRLQGRIYRQRGQATATASYLGAGSTLLTGFGSAGYYGGGGGGGMPTGQPVSYAGTTIWR